MTDKNRTDDLDWEDVRYFVALARHGSLASTARALRVNHATVSRRVANFEARIGKALFERRAEGFLLTRDGKLLLEHAAQMDHAAAALLSSRNAGPELSGPVRLTAGHSLAEGFLIDRLAGLRRMHPAIDLEIVGDVRPLSLARREADLALRFGSPKDSELASRRVGTITFGLYAQASSGIDPDSFARLPLIGFGQDGDFIAEAEWLRETFPGRRYSFRANTQLAQAAAARAGFGMALLPKYLVVGDERLAEVLCDKPLLTREVWLLIRPDLKKVPRVRAVADFIADLFQGQRQIFAGVGSSQTNR